MLQGLPYVPFPAAAPTLEAAGLLSAWQLAERRSAICVSAVAAHSSVSRETHIDTRWQVCNAFSGVRTGFVWENIWISQLGREGEVPRMQLRRAGSTHEELSSCVKDTLQDSGERPQQQESQTEGDAKEENPAQKCNDWFLHVFIYFCMYPCVCPVCLWGLEVRGQL